MGFLSSFLDGRRTWSVSASGGGSPGSGSRELHRRLREHDAGLGCLIGRLKAYSISGADTTAPFPGGRAPRSSLLTWLSASVGAAGGGRDLGPEEEVPCSLRGQRVASVPVRRA
jgi:hypothetical protein